MFNDVGLLAPVSMPTGRVIHALADSGDGLFDGGRVFDLISGGTVFGVPTAGTFESTFALVADVPVAASVLPS